ncbi:MAG TPA: LuxR C-terminal-related transcriptional regulator [Phycisphaerae bacterium]|nr:LuxR C-terminal-related transcriptional regulator [Phycisphaerae bacterium]
MLSLTTRQEQCLTLRLRGMKQKEIAASLNIDQSVVSRSLRAAVRKMQGLGIREWPTDPARLDTMDPRKIVAVL